MLSHSFPIDIPLHPSTHVIYKFIHKGSHAGSPHLNWASSHLLLFLFKNVINSYTCIVFIFMMGSWRWRSPSNSALSYFLNPETHTIFQELPVPSFYLELLPVYYGLTKISICIFLRWYENPNGLFGQPNAFWNQGKEIKYLLIDHLFFSYLVIILMLLDIPNEGEKTHRKQATVPAATALLPGLC